MTSENKCNVKTISWNQLIALNNKTEYSQSLCYTVSKRERKTGTTRAP